jgi:hypothetical protein
MEGWGWINEELISKNGFYRIITEKGKITIYLRTIDKNFVEKYKESKRKVNLSESKNTLVINEYYRTRLGIQETGTRITAKIKKCGFVKRNLLWNFTHPNPYVRHSSYMTLFSLIVGFVALIVTIDWCSLWKITMNLFTK